MIPRDWHCGWLDQLQDADRDQRHFCSLARALRLSALSLPSQCSDMNTLPLERCCKSTPSGWGASCGPADRQQTNGKAERFIPSALREWAYGWMCQNSVHRTQALTSWQHHYNWHRPHSGISGKPPMSRLTTSGNNLVTLHT